MGKITDANKRALENADKFESAAITDMIVNAFSIKLDDLIKEKGISIQEIVKNSNVSKAYINRLRSRTEKKVNPDRYIILDIGLAIGASLEEIDVLLKAAGFQPLYSRKNEEALIIWGLLHNLTNQEIRDLLYEKGYDFIFTHKHAKKDNKYA